MSSHPQHHRAQNRNGPVAQPTGFGWVIGGDLDPELVRSLVPGDQLLCEMNGARIYSRLRCPLAAEDPWSVVSNNLAKLVLQHPRIPRPLRLPYERLLRLPPNQPAVFQIRDQTLSPGPIYVLLQFASYRLPLPEIIKNYPLSLDVERLVGQSREEMVARLLETIRTFERPGWGYRGVCRFSLRSHTRVRIIEAFRVGDMTAIRRLPDATIATMAREMNWLSHLLSVSTDPQ
jgi:hypothetical protein